MSLNYYNQDFWIECRSPICSEMIHTSKDMFSTLILECSQSFKNNHLLHKMVIFYLFQANSVKPLILGILQVIKFGYSTDRANKRQWKAFCWKRYYKTVYHWGLGSSFEYGFLEMKSLGKSVHLPGCLALLTHYPQCDQKMPESWWAEW